MSGAVGTWLEVWNWPFEVQVMLPLVLAVAAFARGGARAGGPRRAHDRWRAASFYTAVAVLVFAVQSPMDAFSERSFAWHMVQHMLLLLAVPPLAVAGQPWGRLWAGLPSAVRRGVEQAVGALVGSSPRSVERSRAGIRSLVGNSRLMLGVFAAYLWAMHLPVVFDAALRSGTIHDLEHLGYLVVGTLYWARAIPSAPFPPRLAPLPRVGYLLGGLVACWVLGVVLTFASSPLYTPYLHVVGATYSGVMSSQVTGGAIMWAPSMIPFDILFALSVQGWLADSARADSESSGAPFDAGAGAPAEPGMGAPGALAATSGARPAGDAATSGPGERAWEF